MKRKDFIKATLGYPILLKTMNSSLIHELSEGKESEKMPVLFVGHGSPMNAIEDNVFSRGMKEAALHIPKPQAILMVSAHWETEGTHITAQALPPTIHDFGGFPEELFKVQYPAKNSEWLKQEAQKEVKLTSLIPDEQWGWDHGCWSITKNMYPKADIPMLQLSLDYTQGPEYHYALGKELKQLRRKGVLIIGSGNIVHNFRYLTHKGSDFNVPLAHDWALEANDSLKKLILSNDYKNLIGYKNYSRALQLAAPTHEHYSQLLYVMGALESNDPITFFNDQIIAGAFSMTSVKIG